MLSTISKAGILQVLCSTLNLRLVMLAMYGLKLVFILVYLMVKNLSPYHALTIFVSVIHSGVAVYTGKETKVRLPNLSLSNKTN